MGRFPLIAAWALVTLLTGSVAFATDFGQTWFWDWDLVLAWWQFVALLSLPVFTILGMSFNAQPGSTAGEKARRRSSTATESLPSTGIVPGSKPAALSTTRGTWLLALGLSVFAATMQATYDAQVGPLPPTIHDEFAYLFGSKLLLQGRFSAPSHPTHPELFNQVHVLNEGRMASRYYPGTSLWLAPFVAMGHPMWGGVLAAAIINFFCFWTVRNLSHRTTSATIACVMLATSPGLLLFGGRLLSHHPCLVGLSIFLWAMGRLRQIISSELASTTTGVPGSANSSISRQVGGLAFCAGAGLSYAMLCRPGTAFAIGLPFGIWSLVVCWTGLRKSTRSTSASATLLPTSTGEAPVLSVSAPATTGVSTVWPLVLGLGVPIAVGWGVMLSYNQATTGNWRQSPYQLYTEIYSPSHVFGFNNAVWGAAHRGPKTLLKYDEWAKNLTLELAFKNLYRRLYGCWNWTFGAPWFIATVLLLLGNRSLRQDRGIQLLVAAIVVLHLVHFPYWFAGMMQYHYVLESSLLWVMLTGVVSGCLIDYWRKTRLPGLIVWGVLAFLLQLAGNNLSTPFAEVSRVESAIGGDRFPRQVRAKFNRWIEANVKTPALVLVRWDDPHTDYIINDPGLDQPILFGRIQGPNLVGLEPLEQVFAGRTIYACVPDPQKPYLRQITP